jgi:glycosyltransferase involved in cell wall biosynthesis
MSRLSIVIPTKNEEDYLPRLLNSIRNQSFRDYEVLVADANSQDDTREIAEDYGCMVVSGGYPGEGRNIGARDSKGDILAFLDSDVQLPHSNFLEYCLQEFKERGLGVAGTYHQPIPSNTSGKRLFDRVFYGFDNLGMRMAENSKIPKMHMCMFATRELHQRIGGFREDLEFAEDADYSKRAVEQGGKFGILKRAGSILVSPRRLEGRRLSMAIKYAVLNFRVWLGKEYKRDGKVKYF